MSEIEIKKHKKSKKSKEKDESEEEKPEIINDEERSHKKHKKSKKSKHREDEKVEEDANDLDELGSSHKKHKKSKKRKSEKNYSENEKNSESDIPLPEVHTANSWEKADLGDGQRKLKFLKLMGASKHTDSKDSAIKSRTLRDNKKVNDDLEKQFTDGLTSKFMNTKHQGLGATNRPAPQNTRKAFSDDEEKKDLAPTEPKSVEKKEEKKSEPTAAYTNFNPAAEAKLKFKKMSFVKSSS